jgi:predicted DNA binding protein
MPTLVKASVPADQFALADTFDLVPAVTFDAVRLVSQDADQVVPLLWINDAEPSKVREALELDETTTEVEVVSQRNHSSLFRMRWTAKVQFLTRVLVDEGGSIVSARGTRDGWVFWVLFPERETISTTYDACDGYDVCIERIQSLDGVPSLGGLHLTDTQFKTVKAAVDSGYYRIPRDTTLEELATDLDVSHQALSERLRRGHRALIESVIRP